MKTKPVQPPEVIRLIESCTIAGRQYGAGDPLPYKSADEVPATLRHLLAASSWESPPKPQRNAYSHMQPPGTPQPETIYTYQGAGDMRGASQVVQGWHMADEAVEIANQPLDPSIAEILQSKHDAYISKVKAQLSFNEGAIDNAHEVVPTDSAPLIQYYVLRGSDYVRAEEVELQPGEPCFLRHRSGTHEMAAIPTPAPRCQNLRSLRDEIYP